MYVYKVDLQYISYVQYDHRCFKTHYDGDDDASNANIKLRVKTKGVHENDGGDDNVTIELPRQLLKIHEAHENATCSLWELALRKVYTER